MDSLYGCGPVDTGSCNHIVKGIIFLFRENASADSAVNVILLGFFVIAVCADYHAASVK